MVARGREESGFVWGAAEEKPDPDSAVMASFQTESQNSMAKRRHYCVSLRNIVGLQYDNMQLIQLDFLYQTSASTDHIHYIIQGHGVSWIYFEQNPVYLFKGNVWKTFIFFLKVE